MNERPHPEAIHLARKMSDLEAKVVDGADSIPVTGDDDDLNDINYKPPAEKKLDDILSQDKDDEALERYKAALLGEVFI